MTEKLEFYNNLSKKMFPLYYVFDTKLKKIIFQGSSHLRYKLGYGKQHVSKNIIELVKFSAEKKYYDIFVKNKYEGIPKNRIFSLKLKKSNGKEITFYVKEFFFKEEEKIIGFLLCDEFIKKKQTKIKFYSEILEIIKTVYWEFNPADETISFLVSNAYFLPFLNEEKKINLDYFLKFVHTEDRYIAKSSFLNEKSLGKIKKTFRISVLNKVYFIDIETSQKTRKNRNFGILIDVTDLHEKEFVLDDKNKKLADLYEKYKQESEEYENEKIVIEKQMALKDEFLHNLSHEIRTPLNSIMGFARLLEEETNYEQQKFFAKLITQSSSQLLKVMDDVYEISKLEAKDVEIQTREVNISAFLSEINSVFNLKSRTFDIPIYLENSISDEDSFVYIDDAKLRKVLNSLLDNSLKYTEKGYIKIISSIENDKILISIQDTGVGIPPDKIETIFERFKRFEENLTKTTEGIGLGLSIAKEFIELMNGKIEVQSELFKGSTFKVEIPFKPVANKLSSKSTTTYFKEENNLKKVLIAEDEEINFVYLDLLLQKIFDNLKIYHAKNGQEAVDMCTKDNTIDVVLMDLKMPVLNGYDATKLIRKTCPNLPIIAVTAYFSEKDKLMAAESGFDDYLTKPIDKQLIETILRKFFLNNGN